MNRAFNPAAGRAQARGVTLVEAMVALLIMSFGMLALVGLQANLRRSADVAKQRSEATKLAQVDMENVRAFGSAATASAPASASAYYDAIASATMSSVGRTDSNATFALNRVVSSTDNPPLTSVDLALTWTDRADQLQTVRLSTFVAGIDPALSGSLMVPPPDGISSRRPQGRSTDIPTGAKDMGDGHSAFKPDPSGTVAWVFNNITGEITNVCTTILPATTTADLTLSDISSCGTSKAYLLSGYVRYSLVSPPDPDLPNSAALLPGLALTVDRPDDYPTPAYQCFARLANATTASYYCLVYPKSTGQWSGRLDLSGISLASYKVCRYSADYDGNGSIGNSEHPASYSTVKGALTRQNFLVIRAIDSCPVGHAASPSTGVFTNTATVLHQPVP